MDIYLICCGLLGLIYVALTLNIARLRGAKRVNLGDGGDPTLLKAIRAHGNFMEFVPLILFLIYLLSIYYGYRTVAGLSGLLVIARVLHAAGMLGYLGVGRVAGAVLTTLILAVSSILLALIGLGLRPY